MSEKVTPIIKEEVVESAPLVEQVTEEVNPEAGKIINYFVGISGSGVYRVSSDADDLNLLDFIESVATIETNVFASILESEDPVAGIALYKDMKNEILQQSVNALLEMSKLSDEVKDKIRSIFA